jgi:hypothetical protein
MCTLLTKSTACEIVHDAKYESLQSRLVVEFCPTAQEFYVGLLHQIFRNRIVKSAPRQRPAKQLAMNIFQCRFGYVRVIVQHIMALHRSSRILVVQGTDAYDSSVRFSIGVVRTG